MARPPKPSSEHRTDGTFRKYLHENRLENHVKPIEEIPEPPADMTPTQAKYWQDAAKSAYDLGVLHSADLALLRHYSETAAALETANAIWQKEGMFYSTGKGMQRAHPAFLAAQELRKMLLAIADRLAFSPKARQSIKTGPAKQDKPDPFLELMKIR